MKSSILGRDKIDITKCSITWYARFHDRHLKSGVINWTKGMNDSCVKTTRFAVEEQTIVCHQRWKIHVTIVRIHVEAVCFRIWHDRTCSIVLRIKRNIVTRINSKRWRYWASVQGYSPSVLALSGTFCSVFPSPTFPSPIFSLPVSHISTVPVFLPCLVFKAIFRFTILLPLLSFYDPLLFLLLLSLLNEREDSANFPYFCCTNLLGYSLLLLKLL